MPLNTTGPISLGGSTVGQSINLEFARAANAPISMSQLYRGGAIVPNASVNAAIAASGAISLGQFYGATRRVEVTVNITANQNNYVFNTAKVPGYVAGVTDVVFNIANGVILSSTATGSYAGDVDTSWAAGDTVRININGGAIVGMGGQGGQGGGYGPSFISGSNGGTGGFAFRAQRPVSINNAGQISAGGGGGGGGRAGDGFQSDGGKGGFSFWYIGGGGGGGHSGLTNSGGGLGGQVPNPTVASRAGSGGAGTASGPGGGGAGADGQGNSFGASFAGGAGGTRGAAGAAGAATMGAIGANYYGPWAGGAGGTAIVGNANITWIATGTRLGAIT